MQVSLPAKNVLAAAKLMCQGNFVNSFLGEIEHLVSSWCFYYYLIFLKNMFSHGLTMIFSMQFIFTRALHLSLVRK